MSLYKTKKTTTVTSLENLLNGGVFSNRRHTVGGKLLNSVHIENILYDSSRSSEHFFGEAYRLLGESIAIESFLDNSIKNISKTVEALQKVKDIYGIENLDPLKFVMESDAPQSENKPKIEKSNLWKNIFNSIIEFFKRIITSIGNFIKSIQVWISGPDAKRDSEFYNKNKDSIAAAYTTYSSKITMVGLSHTTKSKIKTIIETSIKVSEDSIGDYKSLIESYDEVIKSKGDTKSIVDKIRTEARRIVVRFEGVKEQKDVLKGDKATNSISELFAITDIDYLMSFKSFEDSKKMIDVTKKFLALLNSTYARIVKESKNIAGGNSSFINAINSTKNITPMMVGSMYRNWSFYMKERSRAMVACKLLLRESKENSK